MHVVHLETGRHLYGGARQVLYLLEGLAAQGVRCTLICPPDSEICTAAGGAADVVAVPVRGDIDLKSSRRFAKVLRKLKPDVLHVHSRRGADVWGGLAARRTGTPAVLSRRVDNPDVPVIGAIKNSFYEHIITISEGIHRQLRLQGIREDKLTTVHSAIDADGLEPRWTRAQFLDAFDLESDALVVAVVAQLIPRKGHKDILDAWGGILDEHPHARLILFGTGPMEQYLKDAAIENNCAEAVSFAGFRKDLRDYLAHVDLLVHPALKEGLGVCLLEAQAAGVPVVATRVGGIPEAVADGRSGLLVEPEDSRVLELAVLELLADEPRRRELGLQGRAHVQQHFSIAAMVAGNLAVYQQVLESR
ncbi:MAG: glycosyltransferase family 4 protein [Gammaproteobacteria bacterium]